MDATEQAKFDKWWKQYGTYEDANLDRHIAADAWEAARAEQPAEAGELKYCKEHRTLHCSCQQKIIDAKQKEIERLKDVRRGQVERLYIALDIANKHIGELTAENASRERRIESLKAENKAQTERIAELERLRERYENKPAAIECPKCHERIKSV